MDAGRELDILIAEKVMEWVVDWGKHGPGDYITTNPKDDEDGWRELPHYSTDLAAVATVRAELNQRGMLIEFITAVIAVIGVDDFPLSSILPGTEGMWILNYGALWHVLNATPEQQCRAALRAVGYEVLQ